MLNILIKPCWLFTELVVQDRITHESYGLYAALYSLSFLFISLADSGVNLFVTKEFAHDKSRFVHLFSNTFSFKLLACIVYPILITAFGWMIGYRGDQLYYLFLLAFVQAVLQAITFFRSNFQAFQMFKIDAWASVTDKIILLIIVIILIPIGITLQSFIWAVLASVVLTFLVHYIVINKFLGFIRPKINYHAIKEILLSSFPFALIGILYAINERVDMVMLERLGDDVIGKKNAGLYAAAYRWLDAFMMYLWTLMPVFFAKFAANKNDHAEQQKLFTFGQLIAFLPLLFVGVFVFFYGDKLFWMFVHSSKEDIAMMTSILKVLLLTGICQGMFAIYGTYLNSTGHEKKVSVMFLACLFLNIILNWIFIPRYGPIASAYATLASTILASILYLQYIPRKTSLKIPIKLLVRIMVISAGFIIVFYCLDLFLIPWYATTAISGLFLVGITYISNTGNIRRILKAD